MQQPTKYQWNVWKGFIFRNFLSPGTTINPPIEMPIYIDQRIPSLPISEVRTFIDARVGEMSLPEIMSLAPRALRILSGVITFPQDDGLKISKAVVAGECLGASDGSLKQGFRTIHGGHGYTLRGSDFNDNDIQGSGPSPNSDMMSLMTTKHYRLLGLPVLLHGLCKKYKLCREECFNSVLIYIDNKAVVERGRKNKIL